MSPTNHFSDDYSRSWTLAEIYDDLGSRWDVAKALDVTDHRMAHWLRRRDQIKCPYPIKRLGHVDVYSIREWKDWHDRWQHDHRDVKNFFNKKPHGGGESFWEYFAKQEAQEAKQNDD
jgi:hypothetical protein